MPGSSGRPLVLTIDDEDLNIELMAGYLSGTGCELIAARRGLEALQMIEERRPDLVLLDVMMPDLDGFEVCRRIKVNPVTQHIPLVMVTALDQPSDRFTGLDA